LNTWAVLADSLQKISGKNVRRKWKFQEKMTEVREFSRVKIGLLKTVYCELDIWDNIKV